MKLRKKEMLLKKNNKLKHKIIKKISKNPPFLTFHRY